MKKLLLSCGLLSVVYTSAQNIYNSYGYERLTYGCYYAYADSWEIKGTQLSPNVQITDPGATDSDMSLQLVGSSKINENIDLSIDLTDSWDLVQSKDAHHLIHVEFDIKNNTNSKSRTINTLYFELLNRVMDKSGNEQDVALYGLSFSPISNQIKPMYGKGTGDRFSNIGGNNSPFIYTANPEEWTHVRLTYNIKTGFAEFNYGNKLIIEKGDGQGDGRNGSLSIIDLPNSSFSSNAALKDKDPGLARFIIRSAAKGAIDPKNTDVCDFQIDNLTISSGGVEETLVTAMPSAVQKIQDTYLDEEKTLHVNPKTSVKEILVFDNHAKLVASNQLNQSISLAHLSSGIYVVKYNDGQKNHYRRIVK